MAIEYDDTFQKALNETKAMAEDIKKNGIKGYKVLNDLLKHENEKPNNINNLIGSVFCKPACTEETA
jgi:hypothetical protein